MGEKKKGACLRDRPAPFLAFPVWRVCISTPAWYVWFRLLDGDHAVRPAARAHEVSWPTTFSERDMRKRHCHVSRTRDSRARCRKEGWNGKAIFKIEMIWNNRAPASKKKRNPTFSAEVCAHLPRKLPLRYF